MNDKKHKKSDSKDDSKLDFGSIAIFIFFLLVVATLTYASITYFMNKDKSYAYNGYQFGKDEFGLWRTALKTGTGDRIYEFYHHPSELENISFDYEITAYLAAVVNNRGNFTVAYSPELSTNGKTAIAGTEVTKVMGTYIFVRSGFTEILEDEPNLPVYVCEDANPFNYVLEFSLGDENKITSKGFCTKIQAKNFDDLIMMADAYIYRIMGVIIEPVNIDSESIKLE